jgi:DNA repair exonuclease SbcCD ATPase subunit
LIYALYGVPYRKINKPQLINSINRGDMLVEVDFSVNGAKYQVRRGIKPHVFDILHNGKLIDQDAAVRDYQKFLETQILKVSEKTFKQIAVLGAASYVPFMQLPAFHRRELVESILDIEIFSRMNSVLRDRLAQSKDEMSRIESSLELKKSQATSQKKLIDVLKENNASRISDYETEAASHTENKEALTAQKEVLEGTIAAFPEWDGAEYEELTTSIAVIEREIKALKKQMNSFDSLTSCPTCLQAVGEEHKHHVDSKFATNLVAKEDVLQKKKDTLESILPAKAAYDESVSKNQRTQQEIKNLKNMISMVDNSIKTLRDKITSANNSYSVIEDEQEKLKSLATEALSLIERKNSLSEEKHIQDVAQQLLKDSGIKTAVVREYLPVLNQLVNKYLSMFDFFVDFTLDENFSEVIRSRGRDTFSYSSFSEGEKRRIDFAILMAFRQLAAMKNSARTNVLIFDEILDSNLDLLARDQVHDMITNMDGANVIVISHADAKSDDFDRVLVCEKVGDFSTITGV